MKDELLAENNLSYGDLVANIWQLMLENYGTKPRVYEYETKLKDYKQTHAQSTREYLAKWSQFKIEYTEEIKVRNVDKDGNECKKFVELNEIEYARILL